MQKKRNIVIGIVLVVGFFMFMCVLAAFSNPSKDTKGGTFADGVAAGKTEVARQMTQDGSWDATHTAYPTATIPATEAPSATPTETQVPTETLVPTETATPAPTATPLPTATPTRVPTTDPLQTNVDKEIGYIMDYSTASEGLSDDLLTMSKNPLLILDTSYKNKLYGELDEMVRLSNLMYSTKLPTVYAGLIPYLKIVRDETVATRSDMKYAIENIDALRMEQAGGHLDNINDASEHMLAILQGIKARGG